MHALKSLRAAILSLMAAGIAACAGPVSLQGDEATPVCSSIPECQAMWNGARIWLGRNVPFGLQKDTETRLQTYRADEDPQLWAVVERVPLGKGRYRIEATIRCGVVGGCHPNAFDALKAFNRAVNRSYKTFD